jgi:hypothetical protein
MVKRIRWACPKCGANADRHGKGVCLNSEPGACAGFLCECDDPYTALAHGESHDDPCENAYCYHCGWGGTFPVPLFDPKKLTGWAKTALANGWKPPTGWTPTKKKAMK